MNEIVSYSEADDGRLPPSGPPFRWQRLIPSLRRKWWILLLTTLPLVGGATYFTLTQKVSYVSRSTAWVRGKMRVADVGAYTEDGQTFFGTQIQLLQSDRLRERAMERLKATLPDLKTPKTEDGLVVLPVVRVIQAPKSSVFVMECSSPSAAYAKAYLDALMDEFLAYKKEVRTATSGDALASVSAQVYKQETELKLEQEKVTAFTKENNIALLEEDLRGGGGQLAQLNGQIAMLKLELQLLNASAVEKKAGLGALTNATDAPLNLEGAISLSPSSAASRLDFTSAQQQLEVLRIHREQMAAYLRPKHPKMVKLEEEIKRAEKIIEYYRTRNEEQIAASSESTRIRLKSLETAAKELAEKVGNANRKLSELERIRANIARQQSFYDRLLALLQGVDLNSSMNQEDVAVLERASEGRPPKRQDAIMIAGAGMAGIMAGLAIIFLLVRLDDRCDSLVELQGHFPEPVFGQIPEIELDAKTGLPPVLQENDPRHLLVESCRGLRSSLIFGAAPENRPKVIMITSAAPEEGKSTIAINLAQSLAQGGARVLLIDADLRRGHLHELLGLATDPGLAACIRDGGTLPGFTIATRVVGLDLIPRGRGSNDGGQLFLAPSFAKLLENARAAYDFVVVDSMPVFAADDTTTLAPMTDGVLFVVRRAHTSSRIAQEALSFLYQRRSKVLGIIFNRANSESPSYNYYKYSKYYKDATVD